MRERRWRHSDRKWRDEGEDQGPWPWEKIECASESAVWI